MGKIIDYFWHLFLPLLAMVISGFAKLTLLTKNSFLEEINKDYVRTARAKGLSEIVVLFKHVLKNALLPILTGIGREEHGKILSRITEIANPGKLKPLVDPHQFTLEQISDAHMLLESGKARGKVVLSIN